MAQRRETSLRAQQLAQEVHPPSTSNPPRSTTRRASQTSQPFFHRLQTDVTALLRSILADILTLLRGRPSEIKALILLRLSDLRALKLYWTSGIIVYLLLCLQLIHYMPPPLLLNQKTLHERMDIRYSGPVSYYESAMRVCGL